MDQFMERRCSARAMTFKFSKFKQSLCVFCKRMSSTINYAQLVIGPPGSGKSTYCRGMKEFLSAFGRKVAIVNLDPANETLPYVSDVDISELITLQDVMENLKLGPNGSLMYCMEFLEKNMEWLHKRMKALQGHYFLLDCPGQVELYTHHQSMRNIAEHVQKWNIKMVTVHLVDSHYCSDPGKFISVLLTSLSTMVQIELPHINVLSKVDLMEQYGKLAFNLDFYTDVLDLRFLLDHVSDATFFKKYKKLNEALIGLVEDYSLVTFVPLHIEDKESMYRVMKAVDKASGYVFGQGDERDMSMMTSSMGAEFDFFKTASVQEKYLSTETPQRTE